MTVTAVTPATRPWNELELRVLWVEANRPAIGDWEADAWCRRNTFASLRTHELVAMTIVNKPGAADLMEVLRGTPAPSAR